MPIPAYMWLKDDGGADIKGSVDVQAREGSIEIVGFSHGLNIPVDSSNGKITGKRSHSPMMLEKEFDSSSPYLYKAVATGQTLKSAEIRWYRINHMESISMMYDKITWHYIDGNVKYTDDWNVRA